MTRPTTLLSAEAPLILHLPRTPRGNAAAPTRLHFLRIKRVCDVISSIVILAITSPFILLAMALVRLTSRGPAIYTQKRVGMHGREFVIYKIRTMRADAEEQGPRWCLPHDHRVTLVGRLLRKSHLDELPQLWNVLIGEMSLIGPRPERPEFMPKLRAFVPDYDSRHQVLPGITGLAQVQVDADTDVQNVARKLSYDLYYIGHQGMSLELRILACTVLKLFGVPLPALRSLLNLNVDRIPALAAWRQAA
ncbi:MAG: sugar transferase [Gemmataceae bacterium]